MKYYNALKYSIDTIFIISCDLNYWDTMGEHQVLVISLLEVITTHKRMQIIAKKVVKSTSNGLDILGHDVKNME